MKEFLPNFVMFSKDPFRLDLVGLYLGGHEPGNVHFYRIAKERGLVEITAQVMDEAKEKFMKFM